MTQTQGAEMNDGRIIVGERYTQADRLDRDLTNDKTQALESSADDYAALMALHALGYDVSHARVIHLK